MVFIKHEDFDEKPDRETCSAMRHGGFRWAPSVGAWQRQLNNAAIWTAKHIDCLRPLAEEAPIRESVQEPPKTGATPESIATQYCIFLHECYPLPKDEDLRAAQIDEVVQFLRREGKTGADQLALAIAGLAATLPDNPTVQNLASGLRAELAQYNEPGRADVLRQKPQRKRDQER